MRRARVPLLLMLLVCAGFAARLALSALPVPPEGLAEKKYESFSGVLQIWLDEDLSAGFGPAQRWLLRESAAFERAHPGVYLRIRAVPAEKLASAAFGAQPPDMVVFTSGAIAETGLLNRSEQADPPLLPAFRSVCSEYAVPLASGGTVLAARALPDDLSELPDRSFGVPEGRETATVAICERYEPAFRQEASALVPDIGLPALETPAPAAPPPRGTALPRGAVARDSSDALFSALLHGDLAAMPLDQRQLTRLSAAQSAGRAESVRCLNAAGLADPVLYAAAVDTRRSDTDARAELCASFVRHLLDDAGQADLAKYGLFPVAAQEAVYPGVPGCSQIEAALRRSDCVVRGPFEAPLSTDWEAFLSGRASARELMRDLRNRPR